MARDVDDVVGAAHHEQVAVLVQVAAVGGVVVALERLQVAVAEAFLVVPQRGQAPGRQRQLQADVPRLVRGDRRAVLVEHLDLESRHRERGRAHLHAVRVQAHRVGDDGPPRLGLPPVVDDGHVQHLVEPLVRGRVQPLAGQVQRAQRRDVVLPPQVRVGVLLLDGAERRRRREERGHPVVLDHAPERARVGRAHRLALEEHRRAAMDQRPVHDIRVPHHPAHVRRRPEHLARVRVVDGLHRVLQRHRMPAVVAHDALGLPGGARRVEDVQRVGRLHGHAVDGLRVVHQVVPVQVAPLDHRRGGLRPREHDDLAWGKLRFLERGVDQRLVLDDAVELQAAARRDQQLRLRIIDTHRQLVRREPAEHHRVHRAQPRAGQHRDDGLGHHRHVDDDAIALLDALVPQDARELRHLVSQLAHPTVEPLDGANVAVTTGLKAGDRVVVRGATLVNQVR